MSPYFTVPLTLGVCVCVLLGSLAHKVVADSNANAQLKALETLNVFLQRIADEEYVAK